MSEHIDLSAEGVAYPLTVRLGQGGKRGELVIDPDRFTLRWRPKYQAFLDRDRELAREGKTESAMQNAAAFLAELLGADNPQVDEDWVLDHVLIDEVLPLIGFFSNPAGSLARFQPQNPSLSEPEASSAVGATSAAADASPRKRRAA